MKIEGVVNITKQLAHKETLMDVNLAQLEEKFMAAGLERNCFCIFRVAFSDNSGSIYFDYPTDMEEDAALAFAIKVLPE